jgi:3-deoxy-7-phosphoheptulonate synthase
MWIELDREVELAQVCADLRGLGVWTKTLYDGQGEPTGLMVLPHSARVSVPSLEGVEGIRSVARAPSPHPELDKQAHRMCAAGPVSIGGDAPPVLMAGPCSIESEAQIFRAAEMVSAAGAQFIRGGAFKPRTSPYEFQGHGLPSLRWIRDAADRFGLGVVTEVLGEADVAPVAEVADVLQVGSRNMQNFALLAQVGGAHKPVLLKRGMSASVEEWLLAGEHLLSHGSGTVIFCERGIRGFDGATRNLLDLGSVALLRHVFGQPVVVDPSHALGRRDLIVPMTAAAVAAGADGLLIEAHPNAAAALSDGPQALDRAGLDAVAALVSGGRASMSYPAVIGTRS